MSRLKILVDAMYDGLDLELIKLGYDAYSVKKLKMDPLTEDLQSTLILILG